MVYTICYSCLFCVGKEGQTWEPKYWKKEKNQF